MDRPIPSTRLAKTLELAHRQWQAQVHVEARAGSTPPVRTAPRLTIALSREAGANGSAIAGLLGERLGWPVYDRELVQQVAADLGVRATLLDSLDEKHRSWVLECLDAFNPGAGPSADTYCRHLCEVLLSLGAHGDCVIVGRGAAQVLAAATTLRVRVIGEPRDRVRSIGQRFQLPPDEARRRIEQLDRERTDFVHEHFHKDANDPHGYDLILNSSRFRVAECADLVLEALHRLQARVEAESTEAGCR